MKTLDRQFQAMLKYHHNSFMAGAMMPGDLDAAAHFASRVSFDDKLTAAQSLNELAHQLSDAVAAFGGRPDEGTGGPGTAVQPAPAVRTVPDAEASPQAAIPELSEAVVVA